MLRSFPQLAAEPDAPLKPLPANARDVVAWLQQAQVKLDDARQTVVSAGTRMDASWDAVLLACLAVPALRAGAPPATAAIMWWCSRRRPMPWV